MNLNVSDTRTGNQLMLLFCVSWLLLYFADLFGFAWLFISLGLMTAIVHQLDRMVIAGRNAEIEIDVPGVLRKGVTFLFGFCLLLAAGEFLLAMLGR